MTLLCSAGSALAGIVSIERLLAAPPETKLGDLMDRDLAVADCGHLPRAGRGEDGRPRRVERRRCGRARGLRWLGSTPADAEVLLAEHNEDLARIGGYLAGTDVAAPSSGGKRRAASDPSDALAAARSGRGDGLRGDGRRVRSAAGQEGFGGLLRPSDRLHGRSSRDPDCDAADPRTLKSVSIFGALCGASSPRACSPD